MSGRTRGCTGVVGRPSWLTGNGREVILNFQKWSSGTPGILGVVGRPSRMSGCDREALPNIWKW